MSTQTFELSKDQNIFSNAAALMLPGNSLGFHAIFYQFK